MSDKSLEDSYSRLSEIYEEVIRKNRLLHRVGNIALVAFPSFGALNYFVADQDVSSGYVGGAVIGGILAKVGTHMVESFADKNIIDPVIKANLERFESEN